jgi:uncharacterized membrane protein
MKKSVKDKIIATVIFFSIALIFMAVSHYVAGCYEGRGQKTPKWIYYSIMVLFISLLGISGLRFVEVFSKDKGSRK